MAVTSTLRPLLVWDRPADITYPQKISVDMLDASVIGVEITTVETDDDTGAELSKTKFTRTVPVPGSFTYEYFKPGSAPTGGQMWGGPPTIAEWTTLNAGDVLDAHDYEEGIRVTFTFEPVGGAGFTFDATDYDSVDNGTIELIDTAGTSITYTIKNGDSTAADPANQEFDAESSATVTADNFKALVESDNGHNGTIHVTSSVGGVITMVQDIAGEDGYTDITTGRPHPFGSFNDTCSSNPPAAFTPEPSMIVGGVTIPAVGAPFRKLQSLLVNRGDPGLIWEPGQVYFYLLKNAECPVFPQNAKFPREAYYPDGDEVKYYLDAEGEGTFSEEVGEEEPLGCEIDDTVTTIVRAIYWQTKNWESAYLDVIFTVRKPKAENPMRMFNGLVQKFSCNMGWGGDSGNLQLTLIEDPDAVDENGKPDPAILTFPAVGTACYFIYHGFYFGGIFQRWTYSEGSSGKTYDVVITTPSSLLDGVILITDKFQGTAYSGDKPLAYKFPNSYEPSLTYGTIKKLGEEYQDRKGLMYESTNGFPTNVFNIFAHLENYPMGYNDPKWGNYNAIYNSGPSFGFAWTNEDGINAYDTLELLQSMASTVTGERLKSYGDGWNFGGAGPRRTTEDGEKFNRLNHFGGFIRFGDSEYELDLSALIRMMDATAAEFNDDYQFGLRRFRVAGPIIDCNGFFKEVTELCQYDYFVEVQMSIKDDDYEQFEENPDYDPDPDMEGPDNPEFLENPIDGYTRGTNLLPNHYQAHDGYKITGVGGNGGGPIGVKINLDKSKLLDADGNPLSLTGENKRKVIWNTTEDRGVIVVRTMNRQFQPTPGAIEDYILERKRPHGKTPGKRSENAQNDIVSYDLGGELTQNVTQRVVWGAPASRILDYARDKMYPVWYTLADGTPVWDETVTIAQLSATAANGFPIRSNHPIRLPIVDGRTYIAVLFELRMALGGQSAWETFKCFQIANGNEPNGFEFGGQFFGDRAPFVPLVDPRRAILQNVAAGRMGALDMAPDVPGQVDEAFDQGRNNRASKIFSVVKKCAEEFYMKQFMVPLPMEPGGRWNNQKPQADGKLVSNWEISDSAWADRPPVRSIHFFDDAGRLKTCCAWDDSSTYDYSELGKSYATSPGTFQNVDTMTFPEHIRFPFGRGIYSTKASVSPKLSWDVHEFNIWGKDFEGTLMAHCDSGCDVLDYDQHTTPDFGATVMAGLFYGITLPPVRYVMSGKEQVQFAVPPNPVAPIKFLVPQTSTRYVWGPWTRWGTDREGEEPTGQAKNGKMEVVADDNLSPETYGSRALMDYAGRTKTGTNLALFKEQESGSVILAQFPQWKIGDRFVSAGPYVTDMEVSVGSNGATVKYGFNTWTPQFGKLAQYNLDRMAQIRRNSIQAARENAPPMPDAKNFPGKAIRAEQAQRFRETCKSFRLQFLGGLF